MFFLKQSKLSVSTHQPTVILMSTCQNKKLEGHPTSIVLTCDPLFVTDLSIENSVKHQSINQSKNIYLSYHVDATDNIRNNTYNDK